MAALVQKFEEANITKGHSRKEGGREGGRDGGKEGGRKGGRESESERERERLIPRAIHWNYNIPEFPGLPVI